MQNKIFAACLNKVKKKYIYIYIYIYFFFFFFFFFFFKIQNILNQNNTAYPKMRLKNKKSISETLNSAQASRSLVSWHMQDFASMTYQSSFSRLDLPNSVY